MEGLVNDLDAMNLSLLEGLIYKNSTTVLFKVCDEVIELPWHEAQALQQNMSRVLGIVYGALTGQGQ